ncbi:olfactory receptor 5AU1-like [Mustela nigripes]|uniref:olfactory receptor 5AU1-like n=1 Tax=Mustela nigripes TaxID=77151 RepID=UPI002815DF4D|nr:olfactory receptor 5AU1-like [Mustela nigripes]
MWSNERSHMLLVQVQCGTISLEVIFTMCTQLEETDILEPSLAIPGHTQQKGTHVCTKTQEIRNHTSISDFRLLGFSNHPEQQPLLFGLFLGMYLVTMLGNLLIILAIVSDQHLHTPMYFFLANLSLIDTCLSCTIVPKVLVNTITQHHTITYTGCLMQMYFFIALALLDDFLLAVMAYDRYVAICLPLHYTTIMCPQRCLLLVATCWLCAHLLAFSLTLLMAQFSFCASHSIPHFFCDLLPVLKLACSDTQIFQVMMFAEGALAGVVPLACVLVSYAHIMHTILRISSAGGKHKVFSTCGSHLSVVTLFYGTLFLVYFRPSSSYSADTGMVASVIYTMVTPMLNPFIYSLRNRDMKGALWRLPGWRRYSTLQWEIRNHTSISDFLLLGFSDHPEQQPLLFGLFLGMYLVTVLGNLLIILAIVSDQHLHTPMYFFLANLSLIDTCLSCTIVPKVLVNTITQHHTITYTGCLVQMYFFMALALLDDFLLAVMAYDRYVAICLPLHYTTIMCPQRCLLLVASSWLCAHLLAFSLTLLMAQFSFCASHSIPHFFCDLLPVLKLACSDTQIFQVMMFAEAALAGVVPLACVLVSYAHIMHTILRVSSAGGKHKLFSTCGSHLTVVTLFYGTVFLVYFQPSSSYSAGTGMMASVVYTMVTPMLNPFIYSLRNRDMKGALWRLLSRTGSGLPP